MTLAIKEPKNRLNSNEDFSSSSRFFDGIILLEIDSWAVWLKIFMGRVIVATEELLHGDQEILRSTIATLRPGSPMTSVPKQNTSPARWLDPTASGH